MNKKIIFSLLVAVGFLLNINKIEAYKSCALGVVCDDNQTSSCKWCSSSNKYGGGAGYVKGGRIIATCNNASGCWVDAACWTNSGPFSSATSSPDASKVSCCPGDATHCPAPPVCKVSTCSSYTCSTANATNGTSCGANKQCNNGSCVTAPSCVAYSNTVNSGNTVTSSVSAANADKWSAVCSNFTCSAFICEYTGKSQTYSGGNISGTITSSNTQFYNDSGSTKTRQCVYTVTNSATGLKGTCTGTNTVYSGISKPEDPPASGPTCTGYNFTIDSGQSQAAWVSACATCQVNRWSAVCEDFKCDSYGCVYDSSTYTQNYGETIFSGGIFGSNVSYTNTSGSQKSRKCTYKVWNDATPESFGTCVGTVTVNSGDPAQPAGCVGYNYTISSGQSQSAWVSASNANKWSAVCEDFSCNAFNCTYNSPTYTQNYHVPDGTSFLSTFGANTAYINNSGSKQTRKCNFSVWDSATPASKGTCVGSVNVCSAGYTWNGVSCISNSSCVPNNNCSASALANICITDPACFDGCSYKLGTKNCSIPSLTFSANPPGPIAYNTSTNLTWNTTGGVTSCWGWSDDGNWNGWKDLSKIAESTGNLIASKTYNLECWNASGVTTGIKTVNVAVNPTGTYSCSGTMPNGTTQIICANDEIVNASSATSWREVSSCTSSRKCEYTVVSPPACISKCNAQNIANTCRGEIINDGCTAEATCIGTKDCSWREVAP